MTLPEIYRRIKLKFFFSLYRSFTKRTPRSPHYKIESRVYDQSFFIKNLIFKDETWNEVKQLRQIFNNKIFGKKTHIADNHCVNNKIKIIDEQINIKSYFISNDWIYWFMKEQLPKNYLLRFTAIVRNTFTEFQIAFKHSSISERCRFMVVDNAILTFGIVNHGVFFNDLVSVPFKFELNKRHDIQLLIKGNQYAFIVDGATILSVKADVNFCNANGLAFIFWDEIESSKIDLTLTHLQLQEIS